MKEGASGTELVDELTASMAICYAVRGNKEGTIMRKVQAVRTAVESSRGEGSETRLKRTHVKAGK